MKWCQNELTSPICGGQEDFTEEEIFFFGPAACGILVSRPGIEPSPPALEVQSLNHWTAREVPQGGDF